MNDNLASLKKSLTGRRVFVVIFFKNMDGFNLLAIMTDEPFGVVLYFVHI